MGLRGVGVFSLRFLFVTAVLAPVLLVLTACGEAVGPQVWAGRYDLASVNGQAPPGVVASDPAMGEDSVTVHDLHVVGGSITLGADGSARLDLVGRVTTEGGGSAATGPESDAATGVVGGRRLWFSADTIRVAAYPFLVAGGRIDDATVDVELARRWSPFAASVALQFERRR